MIEKRYTFREIEAASGVNRNTLRRRCKALGIEYNPLGYTLPEVKRMIKPRRVKRMRCEQHNVDELRRKLQNDGAL